MNSNIKVNFLSESITVIFSEKVTGHAGRSFGFKTVLTFILIKTGGEFSRRYATLFVDKPVGCSHEFAVFWRVTVAILFSY